MSYDPKQIKQTPKQTEITTLCMYDKTIDETIAPINEFYRMCRILLHMSVINTKLNKFNANKKLCSKIDAVKAIMYL